MRFFKLSDADIREAVRELVRRRKRINGDLDKYKDEPSLLHIHEGPGGVLEARAGFELKRKPKKR